MTSQRHQLQVTFIGSLVDERLPNFLLQYQGALRTDLVFYSLFRLMRNQVICPSWLAVSSQLRA